MPRLPALVITDAERAELERRSRAHTTSQQALRRARIPLAADGIPVEDDVAAVVARSTGVRMPTLAVDFAPRRALA